MAYNDDVFEENNVIREDLPKLRQNFATLSSAFGKDHTPLSTEGDTLGNHEVVKFVNVDAHPTSATDSFYVLNNNGVKELYIRFGSVANLDPIRLARSASVSPSTGAVVINSIPNRGTLGGTINYYSLGGIRRYYGTGTLTGQSAAGFRTNGRTIFLPEIHETITGFGASYISIDGSRLHFSNSNTFPGIVVDIRPSNSTVTLRGKIELLVGGSVPQVSWWIDAIE